MLSGTGPPDTARIQHVFAHKVAEGERTEVCKEPRRASVVAILGSRGFVGDESPGIKV